jgi:phenylacetate-CoA ligase
MSGSADTDAQLNWLVKRHPNYFGAYSPVLNELARKVRDRGIDLRFILLLSFSAVLDDETRELCRTAFGAEIADTYGAEEVGHIAAQCRDCGEYHVSAEATHVELLDAKGTPAKPGELGRVVVTPLYNYAMPLIRYELGDMAEVSTTPSACGRGLPTLRRIVGRYRNLFRYQDGSTSLPAVSRFKLADFIAIKRFQVVQIDLDHVEIRYVPREEGSNQRIDYAGLTERVRSVLRQPVQVAVRRVVQIDRSSSGKYEDCISLVSPVSTTSID